MKNFFIVSAAFNFMVVLLFVTVTQQLFALFGLQVNNGSLSFMYLLMALVTLFGIAYLKIAFNPTRYREIILLGAQAKLSLVAVGVALVFLQLTRWTLLIPLAADLVFAILFIGHYRKLTA